MTKEEAAQVLVGMAGIINGKKLVSYNVGCQINEAVAIACGELMVDAILSKISKLQVEAETQT